MPAPMKVALPGGTCLGAWAQTAAAWSQSLALRTGRVWGHPTAPTGTPWSQGHAWVVGGSSHKLFPKGAAAGREFTEREFAPSRGFWELVPELPSNGCTKPRDSCAPGKQE